MGLCFGCMYIHCSLYFPLDPFKLTPIMLLKILFKTIIYNIGIVLISLEFAKTYKKISTLSYIPSVTITPVIAGLYFIPAFFIVLIVNIYFFIKFNPWKKNERRFICPER